MIRLNRRQRHVARLIVLNVVLLLILLAWSRASEREHVQVAVAKGRQMMDFNASAAPAFDAAAARDLALTDVAAARPHSDLAFVDAIPLSAGEARYWQEEGCHESDCAFVTVYDYTNSSTVESVVNLQTAAVVGRWENPDARPAGSTAILPQAMAIAAADPQVQNILGNIGAADPAMVPMSGWLMDDACRDEWCVDLTFHDPNGSGRIFHVFVNMERAEVARTFYTRGREERSAAKPLPQRNAYSDGCHEQYGWNVCWEMTAHDGVHFQDASYSGQFIFSSAKIGQIEAWYPSWPGGYRDEIGFGATVPPFGGTAVNDLGDGFEVRQVFTEFTRWPNCICCYRYEEAIRFYEDGSFEPYFVSHGPGCDDLSIYRPFWRIDLDLQGPENDRVWLWQENAWEEAAVEFESHPLVDDVSPDGYKLATFDGSLFYRWRMAQTDPLGLDEGYLFLLQFNENEGEGPITTGPGDTYTPPRQWINGDPLSGENIVLWHVPLLKTKKGGPWWCMPDPEPDFSPCEAILHADVGRAAAQSPEEILATPPATATAEVAASPTAAATATATSSPAPTATPRPIDGREPAEIILNAGCGSCHKIGSIGEAHKVGPDLSNIGTVAAERVAGVPAVAYIRQSILEPNAYIAPHCPNGPCLPNIMPQDYAQRLSPEQIETLVAFLLQQRETEAMATDEANAAAFLPTAVALDEATPAPKAFPAPKRVSAGNLPPPPVDPTVGVQILLVTLVFLLTLILLLKGSPDEEAP